MLKGPEHRFSGPPSIMLLQNSAALCLKNARSRRWRIHCGYATKISFKSNQRGSHGAGCPTVVNGRASSSSNFSGSSMPLEFVILEAEEEPPYEIARSGEFLHILGPPPSQPSLVLCEPALIRPPRPLARWRNLPRVAAPPQLPTCLRLRPSGAARRRNQSAPNNV